MNNYYDPEEDNREWWEYLILTIALSFVLLAISSCTTVKYIPIEKVVTKDSIVIQKEYDSIEIKVKEYVAGDTIYRDSIVFRYMLRTDTIHTSVVDSIPYAVEVVREVDRPRTTYEKTMIRLGWSFIGIALAYILYKLLKWYIKLKGEK